jgi:hypothetical protein
MESRHRKRDGILGKYESKGSIFELQFTVNSFIPILIADIAWRSFCAKCAPDW